jgi:transcriptional regulator with XRE-family HTH domain
MNKTFGRYVRSRREARRENDAAFSVRKVAERVGVQPSYISKVERCEVAPPSEATIVRLAEVLEEDADVLLALAGKVSSDLRDVIVKRPQLFSELIRELKTAPDAALQGLVRSVRETTWPEYTTGKRG